MIFQVFASTTQYDDDFSISSTLTGDGPSARKGEIPAVIGVTKPLFPKVRFDESRNQVNDGAITNREECASCWYTPEDIKGFKEERLSTVKKMMSPRRHTRAYGKVLEHVYDICCDPENDDEDGQDLLSDEQLKQLQRVYQSKSCLFVGLERFALKKVHLDRTSRRGRIMDMVLYLGGIKNWTDVESQAEVIRHLSERISEPSKRFALHKAMAQAA